MDDLALCVRASTAEEVISKTGHLAGVLLDVCEKTLHVTKFEEMKVRNPSGFERTRQSQAQSQPLRTKCTIYFASSV